MRAGETARACRFSRSLLTSALLLAAGLSAPVAMAKAQAPGSTATVTGNAERGRTLYAKTYRCYACHGYSGETAAPGAPRLVPLPRTQEAFITYMRKPPTPAMPAFADVPAQDLADVYAYIRSIKPDSPPVESIPLLRDLLRRITQKN